MKSFYSYLMESTKEYRYRVKTVEPIDDAFIQILKKTLFKYDVLSISRVKKTMMQKAPLDFRDMDLAEVSIVDIVLRIPASAYVIGNEIRMAMKLPEKLLVVRAENDPLEIEAEAISRIQKEDAEAILNDGNYKNEDQPKEIAFGDSYNKKFLNYLSQIKANSESLEVPAIEEIKKTNKFAWLNSKDTTIADDFNVESDTVKPVHVNSKKAGAKAEEPNLAAIHSNYDESVKRKG